MNVRRRESGFSLVELMIALAIMGILTVIAVPSYQNYIRSARRADAQGVLMIAANAVERYYAANSYKYTGATAGTDFPSQAPINGADKYYNLSVVTTDSTYTLTATPIGAQASDTCGKLSVTQTGARSATGGASCWK